VTDPTGRLRVSHSDDGARSRVTVFFRLILLIPHLIWLGIWGIGIALVLPVHWVGALILGRPMTWAHSFYSAFVRYALHVYSYWYLAADRYPPFLGEPGYVVDAAIPAPAPQRRWTIALRLFLALPPFILAAALTSGVAFGGPTGGADSDTSGAAASLNAGLGAVIAFLAWFASLARARTPQGLRDAEVYCLAYATQVWGYLFLLTDRFPTSDPRAVALERMPDHPVQLPDAEDDRRRNRWLVLFRVLLAIPHLVWLAIWAIGALIVAVFGWFAVLFVGRLPEGWHRFLAAYVRYWAHVTSFIYVLGGPFPGFVGRAGSYPVDPEIDGPRPQSRWKTGFRVILALPALFLAGGFSTVMFVAGVGAWWAALVTGRVPEGLHRLLGWAVRYQLQAYAYLALLTDRYPYTGPDGTGRPEAAAADSWMTAPEAP
jgi:Fe-S-cluster formation regulator IscX/YfhJ